MDAWIRGHGPKPLLYGREHFARARLRRMSDAEVRLYQAARPSLPMSRLRFLPKAHGLRPIISTGNVVGARELSLSGRFCWWGREHLGVYEEFRRLVQKPQGPGTLALRHQWAPA